MNIGYIITAYTDPSHLNRLIRSLNYNAKFFIHIDRKVDIEPFKRLVKGVFECLFFREAVLC